MAATLRRYENLTAAHLLSGSRTRMIFSPHVKTLITRFCITHQISQHCLPTVQEVLDLFEILGWNIDFGSDTDEDEEKTATLGYLLARKAVGWIQGNVNTKFLRPGLTEEKNGADGSWTAEWKIYTLDWCMGQFFAGPSNPGLAMLRPAGRSVLVREKVHRPSISAERLARNVRTLIEGRQSGREKRGRLQEQNIASQVGPQGGRTDIAGGGVNGYAAGGVELAREGGLDTYAPSSQEEAELVEQGDAVGGAEDEHGNEESQIDQGLELSWSENDTSSVEGGDDRAEEEVILGRAGAATLGERATPPASQPSSASPASPVTPASEAETVILVRTPPQAPSPQAATTDLDRPHTWRLAAIESFLATPPAPEDIDLLRRYTMRPQAKMAYIERFLAQPLTPIEWPA